MLTKKLTNLFIILVGTMIISTKQKTLPKGFVYVNQYYNDVIKPTKPNLKPIRENLRYATDENFTGKIVRGYQPGISRAVLTVQAAAALFNAQETVSSKGYSLLIYDSYRPQKAVDWFVEWANLPDTCAKCRRNYFPYLVNKTDAFKLPDRYVAPKSRHSRGSTVDLTIIKMENNVTNIKRKHNN